MMMKRLFFLFILFGFLLASAHSEETITCAQLDTQNLSSIMNLITTVKSEILGSTPKFCRKEGTSQIAEQVDGKEDALNNFVEKLSALNLSQKDTVQINASEKKRIESITAQVFKYAIVRKMWSASSEEVQLLAATSEQCYYSQLNRLPLQSNNKKNQKSIISIKNFHDICSAKTLEDLTPYMTKDIIAEALLGLKRILPHSFPRAVSVLCGFIDQPLTTSLPIDQPKSDQESIASATEFSNWLKEIFEEAGSSESDDKFSYDDIQTYARLQTLWREIDNEEASANDAFGYDEATIEKNAKGVYSLRLKDEIQEEQIIGEKIRRELRAKEYKEEFEAGLKDLKSKMAIYYQKNIAPEKMGQPLAVKGFPGYYILKTNDGYIFSIEEEARKKALEIENDYDFLDKGAKALTNQEVYRLIYKKQHLGLMELEDLQTYNKKIIKDADGFYLPEDYEEIRKFNNKEKDKAKDMMKGLVLDNQYTPLPTLSNDPTLSFAGAEGLLRKLSLSNIDKIKPKSTFTIEEKSINISPYIDNFYQNKKIKLDNLSLLTSEDFSNIKAYTGSEFLSLNSCLRKNECTENDLKKITSLKSTIEKLKSHDDEPLLVFRGTGDLPPNINAELKKNPKDFVLDKGFMSFSGSIALAQGFATGENRVIFVMKSKSCVGISAMSHMKNEDEFLCPPSLKVNVKKLKEENDETYGPVTYYLLEEVSN